MVCFDYSGHKLVLRRHSIANQALALSQQMEENPLFALEDVW